ncbi:hypothetical protein VMCG_05091 [Cytospora schulzeri]|uniref:Protein kinase domain-containing protein n=1 Tax=Cytospora schulzeri TaxID=448051 RepID=A0A423WMC2_9PEZI|nr:hypothetical protein VMCG_05091 [Valsa malicola]
MPPIEQWNWKPWSESKDIPKTMLEKCLKHPPIVTDTPKDQDIRHLVITRQIRCGEGFDAQLVECHLGNPKDRLVAKIFDPLYLNLDGYENYSPTYFCERHYSCEAAAYQRIKERGLDGRFTPRFEGSWSFEIPVRVDKDREVRREVRLILQELIPGDTVKALIESKAAQKINPAVRMELLAQLMETYSHLQFIGVKHKDTYTRNAMVYKDPKDVWHITLIDFSHSGVSGTPTSKWRHKHAELPMSPIAICWGNWPLYPLEDIEEYWIDPKYRDRSARLCWMDKKWGKATATYQEATELPIGRKNSDE